MLKTCIVRITGPSDAQRFFIEDQDGNFWNQHARCWTQDDLQRTLYNDFKEASQVWRDLFYSQISGRWQHFVIPVKVGIKTAEPISLAQLRAWLAAWVRLECDYAEHGVGPAEDSVATIYMDLSHLKWEPILGKG
jgi:hypothetical protein